MDELKRVTDQIVEEVLKDTENIMWKLARTTRIPGYDADDLMQEMRIKIWRTLEQNHYDPNRTKPTSFYYRVCKNCLIDLNKSRITKYKTTEPQKREYRDCLDQVFSNDEPDLYKKSEYPTSFVQNFSKSFVNLVLLGEVQNEERRISKEPVRPSNTQHKK